MMSVLSLPNKMSEYAISSVIIKHYLALRKLEVLLAIIHYENMKLKITLKKSNHTETPLKPHWKDLQKIIILKFSLLSHWNLSAIVIQECIILYNPTKNFQRYSYPLFSQFSAWFSVSYYHSDCAKLCRKHLRGNFDVESKSIRRLINIEISTSKFIKNDVVYDSTSKQCKLFNVFIEHSKSVEKRLKIDVESTFKSQLLQLG